MQSTPNDVVPCTYLERVVPFPVEDAALAFDSLLHAVSTLSGGTEPELRLGAGRTTFHPRARGAGRADLADPLLVRAVPVTVRSGRMHRHDATLEIGRWSSTASVIGLRVHLRRAPRAAEPGWCHYRAAGVELITAVAGNLAWIHGAQDAIRAAHAAA